jgi:hypothetical protein
MTKTLIRCATIGSILIAGLTTSQAESAKSWAAFQKSFINNCASSGGTYQSASRGTTAKCKYSDETVTCKKNTNACSLTFPPSH